MRRPVEPAELVEIIDTADLEAPVLVVHFEGWIDAGASAAVAMDHLVTSSGSATIARFDTEWLLDHRARRPTMHVVEGVNTGLDWPTIEVDRGRDANGRDLLLLHGAEPDHNWRAFVDAVVALVGHWGVGRMIGLGAYPAAVPHTRPVRLSVTASSSELAVGNYANATLDVPAGMESALEAACARSGVEAIGLWAQVPHYVPAAPYPPAALALVEGLGETAGIFVDTADLQRQANGSRVRLDELVAEEASHRSMVEELERRYDEAVSTEGQMPSSDELAAQIEQFLRDQNPGSAD